jgi:choline dehydrogenase-like flavoprotein
MAAAIVLLHDDGRGSVELGPDLRPRVSYTVTEKDYAKFRKGLETVARIYFAAGARRVHIPHVEGPTLHDPSEIERALNALDFAPNRLATFSAHQMGTAMMGADPSRSVVDPDGRLHGYENVSVVDASVFPTSIGVNPQITIAALADRAARRLIASGKLKSRAARPR